MAKHVYSPMLTDIARFESMLQLPLPTLAGRIRGDCMICDYIPQAVITKMTLINVYL